MLLKRDGDVYHLERQVKHCHAQDEVTKVAAQEKYDELQARYLDLEERLALEMDKSKSAAKGRGSRGRAKGASKSAVVTESDTQVAEVEAKYSELQTRYAELEAQLAKAVHELGEFKAEVQVAELVGGIPECKSRHGVHSEPYIELLQRLRKLVKKYPATLISRPEIREYLGSLGETSSPEDPEPKSDEEAQTRSRRKAAASGKRRAGEELQAGESPQSLAYTRPVGYRRRAGKEPISKSGQPPKKSPQVRRSASRTVVSGSDAVVVPAPNVDLTGTPGYYQRQRELQTRRVVGQRTPSSRGRGAQPAPD